MRKLILTPFAALTLTACCILTCETASAQAPEIVRIEEDWVAYIRNPDAETAAPQILNVIAPSNTLGGGYGLIELNHSSSPSFQHGGYQVQAMFGDLMVDARSSDHSTALEKGRDKLEYTVAIEVEDGDLTFELLKGKSRSWGRFAQDGLRSTANSQNATLADYDPDFSVENTTVNHGAHRVVVLYQRRVRYYSAAGLEMTDTTPRIIHRYRNNVSFVTLAEYEANPEYYNIDITAE